MPALKQRCPEWQGDRPARRTGESAAGIGRRPGRTSPLPTAREQDLIRATKRGDRGASDDLVMAFLPAIDGVARHYRGVSRLDQRELRQEGVVGLLRAVGHYEPALATPFWAYASWWVRQSMQQLVAELTGPVVLSDRAARHLARLKRARRGFQQTNHREPSIEELGRAAELSRRQVEDLIAIEGPPRRLAPKKAEDEEAASGSAEHLRDPDTEGDYERIEDASEAEHVGRLTAALDTRERVIVLAHYGIGGPQRTLAEIAATLGVSVERVRQLESRALGKLRDAVARPPLPPGPTVRGRRPAAGR